MQQQVQLAARKEDLGVDEQYQIPDKLWERIRVLIPPPPPKRNKDRPGPRMHDRKAMNGIFYVLRTGCQWKALPRSLGAKSTVNDRFQEWRDLKPSKTCGRRVSWNTIRRRGSTGIGRLWTAQSRRHPSGGKSTGPNPTDRSKCGTKRSLLVERNGVPLAVVAAGANRNDFKLAEPTLENIEIERPEPTKKHPQNMCMDKGFDFPEIDELVAEWGYTAHIARKGVDQSKRQRMPGYRARRWVVERTHSWMNSG